MYCRNSLFLITAWSSKVVDQAVKFINSWNIHPSIFSISVLLNTIRRYVPIRSNTKRNSVKQSNLTRALKYSRNHYAGQNICRYVVCRVGQRMAVSLAQVYGRYQYSVRFREIPMTQRNIEAELSVCLLYIVNQSKLWDRIQFIHLMPACTSEVVEVSLTTTSLSDRVESFVTRISET